VGHPDHSCETCRNCGCDSRRRRFKRRDLCGKCFYLFDCIKTIERWDRTKPGTLKNAGALRRRYSAGPVPSLDSMSGLEFEAIKSNFVSQLLASLQALRMREARRQGDMRVDGAVLEQKLKEILGLVQLRDQYDRVAERFDGLSNLLNQTFSPEQCRILYGLLDDIEEQTYGQVTDGQKAFEALFQQRVSVQKETPTASAASPVVVGDRFPPVAALHELWLVDARQRSRSGECVLLAIDAFSHAVMHTEACVATDLETLKSFLGRAFRRFGIPARIAIRYDQIRPALTALDVWLIEHDIALHPPVCLEPAITVPWEHVVAQLRTDVLVQAFPTLEAAQQAQARWADVRRARDCMERANGSALQSASRPYLEQILPHEYAPHEIIRRVQERGRVSMFGQIVRVPRVLRGKDIAFRPTSRDGHFEVYFRSQKITIAKLRSAPARMAGAAGSLAAASVDRKPASMPHGSEIIRTQTWPATPALGRTA